MGLKVKSLLLLFTISTLWLAGCDSGAPKLVSNSGGEKLSVPAFAIHIVLTDAAEKKLRGSGESIKGTIFFDGDGTPLQGVKTAPFRDVYLGDVKFETAGSGIVKITSATISKDAYSRLSDQNYHFTINVYSGRRTFKNNILDGGYAQGRFHDLESNKEIMIICDLL
jgi:hypothetical protein